MQFIERPLNHTVFDHVQTVHQLPSYIANLLARRLSDVLAVDQLVSAALSRLPHPEHLPEMLTASEIIYHAIQAGKRILCVVDYDADGICSGAVLQEGLGAMGAQVSVMVTDRHADGYGFTQGACDKVLAQETLPDLVITADLGSSDGEMLAILQARCTAAGHNVQVIVTDHHHISETHPPKTVDAFINPHRDDVEHAYQHPVCGAMVAWNLVVAVRAIWRQHQPTHPASQFDVRSLLDLVAIATIGDMVNLSSPINRAVVKYGLQLIQQAHRPAWQLLHDQLSIGAQVREDVIGYQISPRINALSRMGDDGHTALTWLTTQDMRECQRNWAVMNQNNDDRKDEQALCEALALEQAKAQVGQNRFMIVCHVPEASHGVVGLAAGKITLTFGKPAIVFSESRQGQLTGSARSIPGYDIRDMIERAQARTDGCIIKFGGHSAAAGLTLSGACDLSVVHAVMEDLVREDFEHIAPEPQLFHDGDLPIELLERSALAHLLNMGPFGQGLAQPCYRLICKVIASQPLGKLGAHVRLLLQVERSNLEAIWFNAKYVPSAGEACEFVVMMTENHFRGETRIQATVQAVKRLE
jgi:single-stranded-DNA-specific exonuclease